MIPRIFIFIFPILFLFSTRSFAQKAELSNAPYYNYGKGFGITTPDSLFQLNIRFRMQSRISYYRSDNENIFDGQVRRLRLRLEGFVQSPKLQYLVQLSFAPGDVGSIQTGENINIIRDAVLFYSPNKYYSFGFGQTKLPGNRQRVNSSGALQLTDRSINNASFNIDRDFGLFFNFTNDKSNAFSYRLKTTISTGDGRNYTKNPNSGLAYTAKLELLPFGKFTNGGDYFEGDLAREQHPKLSLSGVYHFNNRAKRTEGETGNALTDPKDLQSYFADAIFKYQGFAAMFSYMQRSTDNPLDASSRVVFTGHGFDIQSSFLNKKDYEIIGRYSYQKPQEILNTFDNREQFILGLTKYVREHIFKIQFEAGYDITHIDVSTTDKTPYARFQIEMGI